MCMAAPLPADFSSYWTRTSEGRPYPELEESLHAETVVVGGGIVGLSVALRLAEEGRKVAVVEALRVGRLVTGGSTAKVTAQHGLIYSYFVETLGRDKAQLYADANRTGMKQIFDWITAFAIPCDLEPRAAYLYSEREGFADTFRAEAEAARALGFDAEHLDSAPLPFKTAAALRFADQAQFNPVKYLDRLALAFAEKAAASSSRAACGWWMPAAAGGSSPTRGTSTPSTSSSPPISPSRVRWA
jgi:glycine/D-amino acid oxidase-like deaminating enzyme